MCGEMTNTWADPLLRAPSLHSFATLGSPPNPTCSGDRVPRLWRPRGGAHGRGSGAGGGEGAGGRLLRGPEPEFVSMTAGPT